MILPSDPLAIPQPGFRSDPVSDSSTWEYGKLENTYSVEHLVDLKMACPEELKQVVIDDFKDITFIEACKIYVDASTTGRTCACKGKCTTKNLFVKKMGVYCSPNVMQNTVVIPV